MTKTKHCCFPSIKYMTDFFRSVVHVVGALTSQHTILSLWGRLGLMFPHDLESERRELLFFSDTEKILNDDLEFTRRSVAKEATRLLSGLKHFQHSDAEVSTTHQY